MNTEESAQLLDLCRGYQLKEITERFHDVLPLTEEQVYSYLLRFMSRGLINCDDEGRWYLMGKGEALLWHYHELKLSLGIEDTPLEEDSQEAVYLTS